MGKIVGSFRVAVFLLALVAGGLSPFGASADVIIDNGAAGTSYTGNWQKSGATDSYGPDSFWSRNGDTYSWRFAVDAPGTYEIFMWWTTWPSRSPAVPVDIDHEGTPTRSRVTIDQQQAGGRWNSLGQFQYVTGKSYTISMTSQPDPSSTCADAVWIKRIDAGSPPADATIIDNRAAATSFTGSWAVSGATNAYGSDSVWSRDGATFTWLFTAPQSARYKLSMWWTGWPSRSASVPVTIEHAAGTARTVVDQQAEAATWKPLGTYSFTAGTTYRVTMTSQPGPSSTSADAVRFELDAGGANQLPTVSDDAATGIMDQPVSIPVLENDFDSDGTLAVATVQVVQPPAHGTAVPQADGTITYTPAAGFKGDDTFTYRVADNDSAFSAAATVLMTIASNQPPTAKDDTFQTAANTPAVLDVLANDTAADGQLDPASLVVVDGPDHGAADIQPDGRVRYTPAAGFGGEDTFSYTVADFNGLVSDPATVTIRIAANSVIDNRDARVTSTGTWAASGSTGFWGADSVWSRDGATFTWLFQPAETGSYTVSMWWTQWPSRSAAVPVDVQHAAGSARVVVNQQQNGGQWNSIGQYTFAAGTTYRITVTAQPGPSSTCADAVKFDLTTGGGGQSGLTASISQITPSPAVLGAPVTLRGSGTSSAGAITGYNWRSSKDGLLGTQASQVTSNLSHGSHQIFFKVQDSTGAWSAEAATSIEVIEHIYACFIYDFETTGESRFTSLIQSMGAVKSGDLYQYTSPVSGARTTIHIVKQMQGMIDALTTAGAHVMVKGHSNYGVGPVFSTATELQQQVIENVYTIDDDRILNLSTPWIHVSVSGLRIGQAYPYWWPVFKDGTSGVMPYSFGDSRGTPPYNYYISYQLPGSSTWYKAETVRQGAIERFPDSGKPAWFASDGSVPNPSNSSQTKYYIVNDTPWKPSVEVAGSWSEDYRSTTQFLENYKYRAAGSAANQVRWLYTIKKAGDYSLYAWWPSYSGNSKQVPYTVDYSGGSSTVTVDQSRNGGKWVKLGDFPYTAGDYAVAVGANATTGRVMADAVRVVSKQNPPAVTKADFLAYNLSGPAPLDVVFEAQSSGDVSSFLWNFGDGSANSTRDYLTHTYTKAGTYTVSFKVTGPNGTDTATKVGYIRVGASAAPLQAEFSASNRKSVAPLTTSFTDRSSGGVLSRKWDFGDGTTSTLTNPAHTYTVTGNYTVTLTVTGSNGATATERKVNFIVADILDLSIDNVDYPKKHYRSKTILFRKELEIPQTELRYRRLLYDSCNSGNYYLGTFNRGIVYYTLNNSNNLGFYEYIRAYLEGRSDRQIWEKMQAAEPVYDYYNFNKPPSEQQ